MNELLEQIFSTTENGVDKHFLPHAPAPKATIKPLNGWQDNGIYQGQYPEPVKYKSAALRALEAYYELQKKTAALQDNKKRYYSIWDDE